MKMLDLFCGPGGAAMGYHRAGWQVLGVDSTPQPDYPFGFVLGDALEYLEEHWMEFDAVHASPPCQFSSALNKGTNDGGRGHVDLVPTVRRRLARLPLPTIVENVKGASLRPDLTLCGLMFGLRTYRHRYFEVSFPVPRPGHPEHLGRVDGWRHGRWRTFGDRRGPGGRDPPPYPHSAALRGRILNHGDGCQLHGAGRRAAARGT